MPASATAIPLNRQDVAALVGCSPRRIGTLVARDGLPVVSRGKPGKPWIFDGRDVLDWILEREREALAARGDELEHPRNRLLRAQAEKAELEAAKLRGDLISLEDDLAVWIPRIERFAIALRTLRPALAQDVAERSRADCNRIIQEAFERILDEALGDVLSLEDAKEPAA